MNFELKPGWIVINEVRLDANEIIGYAHVFEPAKLNDDGTQRWPEESYVEVYMRRCSSVRVNPTDECHTSKIIAKLDHAVGIRR